MGSVKDLEKLNNGLGRFHFSDRYSVFDWGEMPDHIDGKGAALCITSAYFFEKIEEAGIKTHYLGLTENGIAKRLADLKNPQNVMEIKLVRVLGNDYSVYKKERGNFLVPLEVIYRNYLPEGSSVFKRLKDGTLKLEDIGLSEPPKAGQKLSLPIFDVSTKLESTDRYLSWNEAAEISGLDNNELNVLKGTLSKINSIISREAGNAGLVNEDGKVEFGFNDAREFVLLDTVGTLDECRFTFDVARDQFRSANIGRSKDLHYDGVPVSKEILRKVYRGSKWYNDVEEAKKTGRTDWKKLVKEKPDNLPKEMKELVSQMYKAACNEITGRKWFDGVPALGSVLGKLNGYRLRGSNRKTYNGCGF